MTPALSHYLFNGVDYLFPAVDYLFKMVYYLFSRLLSLKSTHLYSNTYTGKVIFEGIGSAPIVGLCKNGQEPGFSDA